MRYQIYNLTTQRDCGVYSDLGMARYDMRELAHEYDGCKFEIRNIAQEAHTQCGMHWPCAIAVQS